MAARYQAELPRDASVDDVHTLQLMALDQFGNIAQDHNATVRAHFRWGGEGVLGLNLSLVFGEGSARFTLTAARNHTVSIISPAGVQAPELSFVVAPGQPARYNLSTQSSPLTADESIDVTITLTDQFGNLCSREQRAAQLSILPVAGGQALVSPIEVAILNGVAVAAFRYTMAEAIHLEVTDQAPHFNGALQASLQLAVRAGSYFNRQKDNTNPKALHPCCWHRSDGSGGDRGSIGWLRECLCRTDR